MPKRPPAATVKSQGQSWGTLLVILLMLLGASGATLGGLWMGVLLMIDPDALVWVNRFLPGWTRIPIARSETIQTLEEIRDSLRQQGLQSGEWIVLEVNEAPTPANKVGSKAKENQADLLIPILKRSPHCSISQVLPSKSRAPQPSHCDRIAELRIYRPMPDLRSSMRREQQYFQMVSQVPVAEPDEAFVVAPLIQNPKEEQGSARPMPLTRLRRFEGKTPSTGLWFNLSGQYTVENSTLTYGQVIHYNPSQAYLNVMLTWTSPAGKFPYWQEVTGEGTPELLVNQTIGLEPQFLVYRLEAQDFRPDPIRLDVVSLQSILLSDRTYRNVLGLARSGLWSPAFQTSQAWQNGGQNAGRSRKAEDWSAEVQAQLDVIRLHAYVSRLQADRVWASSSQQVLTSIIDGRWGKALQLFETAADGGQEIAALLRSDSGRLWKRVTATLKVNPAQRDVKAWGALLIAAKQGRSKAIAWLQRQPKTSPQDLERMAVLFDQLATALNGETQAIHPSRIVGTATPIAQVVPQDWWVLNPGNPLKSIDGQRWYQVQILAFQDGQQWRQFPFTDLKLPQYQRVKALWKLLGLENDDQMQIMVWSSPTQPQTLHSTVKAVRWDGNTLRLLVAADPTEEQTATTPALRPLAVSASAVQWLEPETLTLADLQQQQPDWITTALPFLWQELQSPGSSPPVEELLSDRSLGDWVVQRLDLTGDGNPEVLLVLDSTMVQALHRNTGRDRLPSSPRTLIFSSTGALLYSEWGMASQYALMAIANLQDNAQPNQLPTLVMHTPTGYKLQRWSMANKQFE